MAGRICLIKSVLNSLSLYFMSIFLMPKGMCRLLTSIQRKFLWSGTVKMRKICKVLLLLNFGPHVLKTVYTSFEQSIGV